MTLSINLPAHAESRLREQAAAAGKDVAVFVQEAIEEKLATADQRNSKIPEQGSAEWLTEFNAWIASHPARAHLVDDSRDAIYSDERD